MVRQALDDVRRLLAGLDAPEAAAEISEQAERIGAEGGRIAVNVTAESTEAETGSLRDLAGQLTALRDHVAGMTGAVSPAGGPAATQPAAPDTRWGPQLRTRRRGPGDPAPGTTRLDSAMAGFGRQVDAYLARNPLPGGVPEQAAREQLAAVLSEASAPAEEEAGERPAGWDTLVSRGLALLSLAPRGPSYYTGLLPGWNAAEINPGDTLPVDGVIRAHASAASVSGNVRYEIESERGRDASRLTGSDMVMFDRGQRFRVTDVTPDHHGTGTRVIRLGDAGRRRPGPGTDEPPTRPGEPPARRDSDSGGESPRPGDQDPPGTGSDSDGSEPPASPATLARYREMYTEEFDGLHDEFDAWLAGAADEESDEVRRTVDAVTNLTRSFDSVLHGEAELTQRAVDELGDLVERLDTELARAPGLASRRAPGEIRRRPSRQSPSTRRERQLSPLPGTPVIAFELATPPDAGTPLTPSPPSEDEQRYDLEWQQRNPWWYRWSGYETRDGEQYSPTDEQRMYLVRNWLQVWWIRPDGDRTFAAVAQAVPQYLIRQQIAAAAERSGITVPSGVDGAEWLLQQATGRPGVGLLAPRPYEFVTGGHLRVFLAYLLEQGGFGDWGRAAEEGFFAPDGTGGGVRTRPGLIESLRIPGNHDELYASLFPEVIAYFLDLPLQVLQEDGSTELLPRQNAGLVRDADTIVQVGDHFLATVRQHESPAPHLSESPLSQATHLTESPSSKDGSPSSKDGSRASRNAAPQPASDLDPVQQGQAFLSGDPAASLTAEQLRGVVEALVAGSAAMPERALALALVQAVDDAMLGQMFADGELARALDRGVPDQLRADLVAFYDRRFGVGPAAMAAGGAQSLVVFPPEEFHPRLIHPSVADLSLTERPTPEQAREGCGWRGCRRCSGRGRCGGWPGPGRRRAGRPGCWPTWPVSRRSSWTRTRPRSGSWWSRW